MVANGAHVVMNHIYSYAFREQDDACVLRFKNIQERISPILREMPASKWEENMQTHVNLYMQDYGKNQTYRIAATGRSVLV